MQRLTYQKITLLLRVIDYFKIKFQFSKSDQLNFKTHETTILLICLLITMQQVNAQTISRYVIPTNGSEYKDSNIHVSATIGETFTYTLNNNNITATQGIRVNLS